MRLTVVPFSSTMNQILRRYIAVGFCLHFRRGMHFDLIFNRSLIMVNLQSLISQKKTYPPFISRNVFQLLSSDYSKQFSPTLLGIATSYRRLKEELILKNLKDDLYDRHIAQ